MYFGDKQFTTVLHSMFYIEIFFLNISQHNFFSNKKIIGRYYLSLVNILKNVFWEVLLLINISFLVLSWVV